MAFSFVNRERELRALGALAKRGGLCVIFGRRRIGKTRMLTRWFEGRTNAAYSQAIEGPRELQLTQVAADLGRSLGVELVPRSWTEFFELVRLRQPRALCLDEFPYLVAADPSLPSILQKWIDHAMPKGMLLVLAGSSQGMMHDLFLQKSAALYGRAAKIMHVEPMTYANFCLATGRRVSAQASFELFSIVGGVPRYWELLEPKKTAVASLEALYFGYAPFFEEEPARLLKDAAVTGSVPLALLEVIGRGASRPSEMAARLGTTHANLTRPLELLRDASLIVRDLPFGESARSTKRTLYRISDPALRFWFSVHSPHQTRWRTYDAKQKSALVRQHASVIFEEWIREGLRDEFPDTARYWEKNVELDVVHSDKAGLVVGEVKFRAMSPREKEGARQALAERFRTSQLAAKHPRVRFEIFDTKALDVR